MGNYNEAEIPEYVFDSDKTTKYNSYGVCSRIPSSKNLDCGINTGFYVVLRSCPSLLIAFRFRTANDLSERDPFRITIEGSNQNSSDLLFGSSWTLIYSGSTGLDTISDRYTYGVTQWIPNNLLWFKSYRVLVIEKRDVPNAVQYADVDLYGYYY
jgi:hypothetical protein